MGTILVVCTGNICRSPMAEGFLRRLLAERRIDGIIVESAGVSGWDGSPAVEEAVQAMTEREIDITSHRARRLSHREIAAADLVLAMSAEHRDGVARVAPGSLDRTFTLKELVGLLDQRRSAAAGGDPEERLRETVQVAEAMRRAGRGEGLLDEDIADPLGLSLQAFRASAWELGELCQRLVDQIFGRPASVATARAEEVWGRSSDEPGPGGDRAAASGGGKGGSA